jgi:hypothetical protein
VLAKAARLRELFVSAFSVARCESEEWIRRAAELQHASRVRFPELNPRFST